MTKTYEYQCSWKNTKDIEQFKLKVEEDNLIALNYLFSFNKNISPYYYTYSFKIVNLVLPENNPWVFGRTVKRDENVKIFLYNQPMNTYEMLSAALDTLYKKN